LKTNWTDLILNKKSPSEIWKDVFDVFLEKALSINSPSNLHSESVIPDRLLSESAWELWHEFPQSVERTSLRLAAWTNETTQTNGKAVLILDALSLRELFILAEEAKKRNVIFSNIAVTGSECPSTTDDFAKSLGVSSRSSIKADKKSSSFIPFNGNCYTDVYNMPFEDCSVPPTSNLFIWHSWLDDHIHLNKLPDELERIIRKTLQTDGFWEFIDKLRQGRKLVITSDHGYAVSKNFSTQVEDPVAVTLLRHRFGAMRYCPASSPWEAQTIPPIVMTHNNQHVIIGQNKWKIQGGSPHVCHGGMTLLETIVPWIEMEAL
jgi:hypothetical protein